MGTLLNVQDLLVWDDRDKSEIVKHISFSLEENTCLAIVGESGSGKSMTCRTLMGLNKPWIRHSGSILLDGEELSSLSSGALRKYCGRRMCMIMQNGMTAFDPTSTIRVHFRETLKIQMGYDRKTADQKMIEAMKKVMLREPELILTKYPHQLSGGMLQRCMIALTLVLKPEIIIADEPTTALDSISQNEVLDQFIKLKRDMGNSMIFISHDLGVVRRIADHIVVMKEGELVESGSVQEVLDHPQHAYTRYLVSSKLEMSKAFQAAMERK